METLECTLSHGVPARLACEVAGDVTCQNLTDGVYLSAEEAGTIYVLLAEGSEEPWQIAVAREHDYTIEVQYGTDLVIPPPDPPLRRRSS